MSIYKSGKVFTDKEIEKLKSQKIGMFTIEEAFARDTGIKGKETLSELVEKFCVPPLGGESIIEEWNKYGYTYSGICDGYVWRKDKFNELTETEVWKMLALSNIYWQKKYEEWLHNAERRNND